MLVFTFEEDYITAVDSQAARDIISAVVPGPLEQRRATHIVPANGFKRLAFKLIRFVTGDGKRFSLLENWTRRWKGPHLTDLRPSGGHVAGPFPNRQSALDYEVNWLYENL